jgi:serpin B
VADHPSSPAPPSGAATTAPPPPASASSWAAATDASAPPQRRPSTAADAQLQASAEAGNAFALSFYQRTRSSPGNIVMSGTSLRLALQMVLAGARGETAAEMARVLGVTDIAASADVADGELAGGHIA